MPCSLNVFFLFHAAISCSNACYTLYIFYTLYTGCVNSLSAGLLHGLSLVQTATSEREMLGLLPRQPSWQCQECSSLTSLREFVQPPRAALSRVKSALRVVRDIYLALVAGAAATYIAPG
jgi:hypothetical protein